MELRAVRYVNGFCYSSITVTPCDQTLIKSRIWFGFRTLQESGIRKKIQEIVCTYAGYSVYICWWQKHKILLILKDFKLSCIGKRPHSRIEIFKDLEIFSTLKIDKENWPSWTVFLFYRNSISWMTSLNV